MRRDLAALAARPFDVVVVGGGIHGAAVARDAALRGLAVALLERDDFGAGASGNSLGIVHGGLRYLQRADLRRVRESVRERRAWLATAPHLVRPLPVLVPTWRGRGRPRALLAAALLLNDLLSAGRNRGVAPEARLPRGRVVSRREALGLAPWLDPAGLTGGVVFHDARMVDPDRLTLAVVRDAVEAGARVANHLEAERLLLRGGRVEGVRAVDRFSGARLDVRSRLLVDATGGWGAPWLVGGSAAGLPASLARGMNVVVGRPLVVGEHAVGLPGPGARFYFVAPWGGVSAIGTAYRPWTPAGHDRGPDAAWAWRFLAEVGPALGDARPVEAEVTRLLVGLLPCDDTTGRRLSSRARVIDHGRQRGPEGLLSVIGVKYTTARAVAERVVDLVVRRLGRKAQACVTRARPLPGAPGEPVEAWLGRALGCRPAGVSVEAARRLLARHGRGADEVLSLIRESPGLGAALPGAPALIRAEVVHAVRREMACTLADIVVRRTGLAQAGAPAEVAVAACASLAAAELGWDAGRLGREREALRTLVSGWRVAPPPLSSTGRPR